MRCAIMRPMTNEDAPRSTQIATNKKARFEYEILERVEAGIVLKGTEVKSLRNRKVSLSDAYARFQGGGVVSGQYGYCSL